MRLLQECSLYAMPALPSEPGARILARVVGFGLTPIAAPACTRIVAGLAWVVVLASASNAGEQYYEPLADSVRTALRSSIGGQVNAPEPTFDSPLHRANWLAQMSAKLPQRWKPTFDERIEFLLAARYEAQRAGLEPELVLGLIEVESNFRRYAVSSAGARGYMQVMPFWVDLIGDGDVRSLFVKRINLRFGCTILRHYLDREEGNLFRALGRYNGSLGRALYPDQVQAAWQRWAYKPASIVVEDAPAMSGGQSPQKP